MSRFRPSLRAQPAVSQAGSVPAVAIATPPAQQPRFATNRFGQAARAIPNLAKRTVETPAQQVGFALLALFLFHSSGRIFDFYLQGYRFPLMIALGCLCCLLMTGGLFAGIRSRIGIALLLY